MKPSAIVTMDWVYSHLLCEFTHWDYCLTGLVDHDGERSVCVAYHPDEDTEEQDSLFEQQVEYKLYSVDWDAECEEYLEDYRIAYKHWFYENGKRPWNYDSRDLGWFSKKWKLRNPIVERATKEQ